MFETQICSETMYLSLVAASNIETAAEANAPELQI